jgi:hypothetical protein
MRFFLSSTELALTCSAESLHSFDAMILFYCPDQLSHNMEFLTLKMEAIRSSETLVISCKTTRRHNPEDHDRHLHHRENLRSQGSFKFSFLLNVDVKFEKFLCIVDIDVKLDNGLNNLLTL